MPLQKHERAILARLDAEGFSVEEVWHGKKLRLAIRNRATGRATTITVASSPQDADDAANMALQSARRQTRMAPQ